MVFPTVIPLPDRIAILVIRMMVPIPVLLVAASMAVPLTLSMTVSVPVLIVLRADRGNGQREKRRDGQNHPVTCSHGFLRTPVAGALYQFDAWHEGKEDGAESVFPPQQ